MKKLTIFLTTALLLAACGPGDDRDQDNQDHHHNQSDTPGELLQSSLERELSPQVGDDILEQLAADNRDFAFDLLHQIMDEEDANIFYSPHSISIALAMTYAGATGGTHEQMGDTLRFMLDEEDLHPAFNALDLDLAARSDVDVDGGDPPVLNVVNATWGQYDYPFSDDYLDLLALHYGAGLRAMDFRNQPEVEREKINQWVEDQTEERIKDLLPQNSIEPSTALVLTNAIYFLAGWHHEFHQGSTVDAPFTRRDGTEVTVDMMHQNNGFPYYLGDDTHAISLPYVGRELSFIALKPADADAHDQWVADLDRQRFDQVIDNLRPGNGDVALPRFTFQGDYDLKRLFEQMGWTNMAELARMVEDNSLGLEITDILHKSFIDLDEEGTEAAAATAVVVADGSFPADHFNLRFDRTFYYAIYDHPTDTILFLGRVDDPTAEQ